MDMNHHYDRNRKAVQKGLDHRKALRLEAQQDAAQLEFINGVNAHSKTVQAEREAHQRAMRLDAEKKRMDALNSKSRVRKEGKYFKDFCSFLNHTFPALLIATAFIFFYNIGIAPDWIAVTGATIAFIYSCYKFITGYPIILANMLREARELKASPALKK